MELSSSRAWAAAAISLTAGSTLSTISPTVFSESLIFAEM